MSSEEEYYKNFLPEQQEAHDLYNKKFKMAKALFKVLDIPIDDEFKHFVPVVSLYNLLMDETKLKILVSKLKNKAFW